MSLGHRHATGMASIGSICTLVLSFAIALPNVYSCYCFLAEVTATSRHRPGESQGPEVYWTGFRLYYESPLA
jgi:hypothetical protein